MMKMTNAVKQSRSRQGYCVPLRMKALVGRLEMIGSESSRLVAPSRACSTDLMTACSCILFRGLHKGVMTASLS